MKIVVKQANIVEENVDVIVNPANSWLKHGAGCAKAISDAGGPDIQETSDAYIELFGKLDVAQAILLPAGDLPCKLVCHVVGPKWSRASDAMDTTYLVQAVWNVMLLVSDHQVETVAIPAISSGLFGFPKPKATEVIFRTVEFWSSLYPTTTVKEVRFVNIDQETTDLFQALAEPEIGL